MDNIRTCRWCRKIYRGYGEHLCPECVQKMDDAFVAIRAYLDDHPRANAAEIIKATGMEEKIVVQLLRDERLSEYTDEKKKCEMCNEEITGGRLCDACKTKMAALIGGNGSGHKTVQPPESNSIKGARDMQQKKSSRAIRLYDE